MARITSLGHWYLGGVGRLLGVGGRWITRKCISLRHLTILSIIILVDTGRACMAICLRLAAGEGWHGVSVELRQYAGRQKDRIRRFVVHGWRVSSLVSD